MLSQDAEVIEGARRWLAEGRRVALITVAATWGSSPRPAGSLMAIGEGGGVVGSVSGGCIEEDLMARLESEPWPAVPEVVRYGVDADEASRFGLPCGGSMALVVEPLRGADALDELMARIARGERLQRRIDLASGEVTLRAAEAGALTQLEEGRFSHTLGPRYRLLIIGAGQLSVLLAQIALSLEFAVTVCEPRARYREAWSLTGATLVTTMPDDALAAMKPDRHTAVVALTHDPKLDDLVLLEALASPAFYVAALGSRRNRERRRERLRGFELSEAQLDRLHGPAGLAIGSRTPAEIAVSIAAQLVAAKSGALAP